jgi:hypothetical protein
VQQQLCCYCCPHYCCATILTLYSAYYIAPNSHPHAAYLAVASESYNLSWVNCEMASFIHMKASSKFYQSPQDEVSAVRRSVHTAFML